MISLIHKNVFHLPVLFLHQQTAQYNLQSHKLPFPITWHLYIGKQECALDKKHDKQHVF